MVIVSFSCTGMNTNNVHLFLLMKGTPTTSLYLKRMGVWPSLDGMQCIPSHSRWLLKCEVYDLNFFIAQSLVHTLCHLIVHSLSDKLWHVDFGFAFQQKYQVGRLYIIIICVNHAIQPVSATGLLTKRDLQHNAFFVTWSANQHWAVLLPKHEEVRVLKNELE